MCKVVLVGYMGSGKSFISKLLAEKNAISLLELDEMIVEKAEMSIKTIFDKKGELYFRKLEHQLFLQKMESDLTFVMSTGGGTPCYFDNHKLLQKGNCVSVYLKASIETLFDRLINHRENRPLLNNLTNDELKEFIAKHLFERSYYYHQAQHVIVIDDKTPDQIVSEIQQLLL